jgi:hypothetical protein
VLKDPLDSLCRQYLPSVQATEAGRGTLEKPMWGDAWTWGAQSGLSPEIGVDLVKLTAVMLEATRRSIRHVPPGDPPEIHLSAVKGEMPRTLSKRISAISWS